MAKPWRNSLNPCTQLYPVKELPLHYKLIYIPFCLKKSSKSKLKLACSAGNSFLVRCRDYLPSLPRFPELSLLLTQGILSYSRTPCTVCGSIPNMAFFWLSSTSGIYTSFTCGEKDAKLLHVTMLWLCNECPEAPLRSHALVHLLRSLRWLCSSSCSHHLLGQCAFALQGPFTYIYKGLWANELHTCNYCHQDTDIESSESLISAQHWHCHQSQKLKPWEFLP